MCSRLGGCRSNYPGDMCPFLASCLVRTLARWLPLRQDPSGWRPCGAILLSGLQGILRAVARLHMGCGVERLDRLRRVFAVLRRMNTR